MRKLMIAMAAGAVTLGLFADAVVGSRFDDSPWFSTSDSLGAFNPGAVDNPWTSAGDGTDSSAYANNVLKLETGKKTLTYTPASGGSGTAVDLTMKFTAYESQEDVDALDTDGAKAALVAVMEEDESLVYEGLVYQADTDGVWVKLYGATPTEAASVDVRVEVDETLVSYVVGDVRLTNSVGTAWFDRADGAGSDIASVSFKGVGEVSAFAGLKDSTYEGDPYVVAQDGVNIPYEVGRRNEALSDLFGREFDTDKPITLLRNVFDYEAGNMPSTLKVIKNGYEFNILPDPSTVVSSSVEGNVTTYNVGEAAASYKGVAYASVADAVEAYDGTDVIKVYTTVSSLTVSKVVNFKAEGEGYISADAITVTLPFAKAVADTDAGTVSVVTLGEGTEAAPYEIASVEDFVLVANCVAKGNATAGKFFALTADVDFEDAVFAGIGTSTHPFQGTFDGDNYDVVGYKLPALTTYQGFFMYIDGATIKNVTFEIAGFDEPAQGYDPATFEFGGAAVVGVAKGAANFINVTASGTITGGALPAPNHTIAGIAVQTTGNATFTECTNNVKIVNGQNRKTAGFVATPKQTATGSTLTFVDCVNNGDIDLGATATGDGGTAAFCGWTSYSNVIFTDCANNGAITSCNTDQLGSFCGKLYATVNVTLNGTCTTTATTIPAMGKTDVQAGEANGFNYATIDDGVATFVATPVAGGTYNVMLPTASPTVALAAGGSITFVGTPCTLASKIGITTSAAGYEVTEDDGEFTATAIEYAITYTYTDGANELTGVENTNPEIYTVNDAITIDTTKITLANYTVKSVDPASWNAGETGAKTVTVTLESAAQPVVVDPTNAVVVVEIAAESPAAAEAAAIAAIKTPDAAELTTLGITAADYQGYFKATAGTPEGGKYPVAVALDDTKVAPEASDVEVGATGVTVPVANKKPGLWYSLESCDTLGGTYTEGARQKAGAGDLNLTAPKGGASSFYRVVVNPADKADAPK